MTWAISVPILVFLGLSVLELRPMYVTDRRQTDKHQTKASLNASALWERGITRRLATATVNASAFLSQKFLVRGRGHGRPCKMFISSSLITMQNLVPVCHTVWVYVGPKNCWGYWGSLSLSIGVISDRLVTCHSHTCYCTEFGHLSQTVWAYVWLSGVCYGMVWYSRV